MGFGPAPGDAQAARSPRIHIGDLDVIELNEAFAAQALAVTRTSACPTTRRIVNPNGGAIALGHPLGMSGARLVITAVNQLIATGGKPCAVHDVHRRSARASRWCSSASWRWHVKVKRFARLSPDARGALYMLAGGAFMTLAHSTFIVPRHRPALGRHRAQSPCRRRAVLRTLVPAPRHGGVPHSAAVRAFRAHLLRLRLVHDVRVCVDRA
jgi:hypothetical protein